MSADVRASADMFRDTTCSAPAERTRRMRDIVMRHVPSRPGLRVLDLGCGTGSLIEALAVALPDASLTGIDVSAANVRAARARQLGRRSAESMDFDQADYLTYDTSPFDVIVSDTVLHLIPGTTEALFEKLARDMRAGGLLICSMPYDCAYNRAFAVLRRLLKRVRSTATDALILRVGRILHGREMDDEGLRERIEYMYIPPARFETRWLTRTLGPTVGLRVIAQYPVPSISPSQLRHRVTVFEKREA